MVSFVLHLQIFHSVFVCVRVHTHAWGGGAVSEGLIGKPCWLKCSLESGRTWPVAVEDIS